MDMATAEASININILVPYPEDSYSVVYLKFCAVADTGMYCFGPMSMYCHPALRPSSGRAAAPHPLCPRSSRRIGRTQLGGAFEAERAPKPHKHQDPTNHGFCYPPPHRALEPESEILLFMWSFWTPRHKSHLEIQLIMICIHFDHETYYSSL